MDQPIAITGMGTVTAQGIGLPATWSGILAAREALAPWPNIDPAHPLARLKVAACGTLPRPRDLPPRLWNALSRTQQLACVATDEALAHAQLPHDLHALGPVGLFLATTVCGMDINEQYYAQYRQNPDTADVNLIRRLQPHEVATLLRRRHNIHCKGINAVCLTTCVGSAMAIGAACDAIALGECDLAIAGGSEALCRVVLSGFNSLKVVSPDGCRPFDLNRPGITVGEGAGILILESIEHAKRHNVTPLAYIRGFGLSCDAHHITAPDPEARQATRAIQDALQRANLTPNQIDYLNAHGTGTRDNDAMETRAIRAVFGNTPPLVSSTKRCTGHTFGAAGAIEAILCAKALREQIAPPNAGSIEPDPALDLPIIRGAPIHKPLRNALSTNFAFGGNNTALLLSTSPGDEP
ncbi:MAG: beta-ketoacyl-[acyl-carrier-protein] synthase family protein [Phycisphaerae bacterium]